jgi:hypothetical protein
MTFKDLLGREVKVGNYVVASLSRGKYSSEMTVCRITNFTPKMIKLMPLTGRYIEERLTCSNACVLVSDEEVAMYILRKP